MARYKQNSIADECFNARVAQVAVNSASIGQWELARALLRSIGSVGLDGDAERALEAFIADPVTFWSPSVATASPHHIQWLALKQLSLPSSPSPSPSSSHTPTEGAGSTEALRFVRDLVEFRLLLYRAHQLQHCQQQVAASLCQYHDAIALADPSGTSLKQATTLPASCVNFIKNVLTLNPSLGHALITKLTSGASPELVHASKNLQKLYVDAIFAILDELKQLRAEAITAADEIMEESNLMLSTEDLSLEEMEPEAERQKRIADIADAKMETVFDFLSFINPDFAPKDKSLDTLFIHLLKFSLNLGPHLEGLKTFHPGKLYSCLLGQRNTALAVKLQDCEEILRKKCASRNQSDSHAGDALKTDPQQSCREKWKETVFEAVLNKRHFLEDKVEQGLSLIQAGNLQGLSDLLSPLELSPLKPLLLLLGWDRYPDHTIGRELLEVLWPPTPCTQPDLYSACWRLAYQVHLVEWCLQKVQLTLPLPSSGIAMTHLTKASEMFQGLESHSVLYVLYHSTPLGQLDPDEVVEVLGTSPYIAAHLPTMGAGQTPPFLSPFGTPLKHRSRASSPDTPSLVSQVLTPPPVPPSSERGLKPTQERDISLYHAFCAIKTVTDAVNAAGETEGRQDEDAAPPHTPTDWKRKLDYGLSEANVGEEDNQELARPLGLSKRRRSGSAIAAPSSLPKRNAGLSPSQLLSLSPFVQKVKHHLSLVRPLTFQLEVIENVFSLVFLQQSDRTAAEGETYSPTGMPSLPRLSEATDQFLASSETVQAILHILQGCLKPLSEEIRKLPRRTASQGAISFAKDVAAAALQGSTEGEPGAQYGLVDSSICHSQLKQRLMGLKQHINEAVWRLQLVTQQGESEAALRNMTRNVSPQLQSTDSEEESAPVMTSDSSCESENAYTYGRINDSVTTLQKKPSVRKGKKSRQPVRRVKSMMARGSPSLREAGWSSTPQSVLLSLPTSISTPIPLDKGSPVRGLSRSVSLRSPSRRSTQGGLAKEAVKTDRDSGKEGDVEESRITLLRRESKRRKKKSNKGSGASTPVILKWSRKQSYESERQSMVSRMLASPGSLLRSCIYHGNYARANEVLKLKMSAGQFGKTLVQFVESYPNVSQQLVRESKQWQTHSGPTPQSAKGGPSVDTASGGSVAFYTDIQSAIFSASSVLAPMEGLHKLLALPALNDILYFGDAELETAAKGSLFVCGLDKCVSGLIVLDLTCCSPVSGQLVQRLIKMAQQCFSVGLSSLESRSLSVQEHTAAGELPQLVSKATLESTWEQKSDVGPASLLRKLATFATSRMFQEEGEKQGRAPYDLFRNSLHSLDVNFLMAWSKFFRCYRTSRMEVDSSLMSMKRTGVVGYTDEGASSKYAETVKNLIAAFNEQPHLLGSREQPHGTEQTAASSQSVTKGGPMNLIERFNVYLRRLAVIVVQASRESAPSDSPLLLLNELPSTLVGRLLFEGDNILPSHLKECLQPLGVNVIEVALQCCCSTVTVKIGKTGNKGGIGGVIPLNIATRGVIADVKSGQHPDPCQLSHKLLSVVVKVLKGCQSQSGLEQLRELASNSDVQGTFRDVWQFQNVDLTLLDTTEKKTCFYSNVTNLAYLHTLVWYAALGTTLEEQLGVSTEYWQLAQAVGTDALDVFAHFGLTSHCGYTIGQLGTVSCVYLHHTMLLMGADHPKVADGCSLPFFAHLSPTDPMRAFFPDSVERRVRGVIGDGWTSSPFPKSLSPVSMEQSLSACQESTSHKAPQLQSTLGYCLSRADVESESVAKASVPPSPSTQYQLTSSVLTCVQQESELLASLTKLLCGEPGEEVAAPSSAESKPKKETLAQTMPTSRRTDKALSAVSKAFVDTTKSRVTEPHRTARAVSPAGPDVTGKRLQNKTEAELPQSWHDVDLQVEFENFPWMQRFLEQRIVPFSEFDKGPGGVEGLGATGSSKGQFLKSLRKQHTRPSQAAAQESLHVSRKVALLPVNHPELQRTCCEVLVHVLRRGRPSEALHLLWTEPFSGASLHPTLRGLKDMVSRMAFLGFARQQQEQPPSGAVALRYNFPDTAEVLRQVQVLKYMEDASSAAQLVLSTLDCWSVDVNIEMLSYCLSRISPPSKLHPVLQKHLERMTVYQQILQLVDPTSSSIHSAHSVMSPLTSPFSMIGEEVVGDESPQWTSWQEVKTAAKENPQSVLEAILKRGCFELARRWARIDSLDRNVHHEIEIHCLLTMLEKEELDTALLCKTLDCSTTDKTEQLQICEVVLSRFKATTPVTATQPIPQYMVSKLIDTLTPARLEDCKKRAVGIKILLSMPESARSLYQHLVGEPCVLMEQLLVHARFDWAGCAVAILRSEGACVSSAVHKDDPTLDHLARTGMTLDRLDEILTFYATKAMELPSVPDMRPMTPRSPPGQTPTPTPGAPNTGSLPRMHRRTSSSQTQLEASTFESSMVASGMTTAGDGWHPPHRIPKQHQWVPNREAEKCMACKKVVFGTFNRRHHCRRCGEVVCAKCSSWSLPIEGYSNQQRACWRCYQYESKDRPGGGGTTDMSLELDFEVRSVVPPMLAFGSHEQWLLRPNDTVHNCKTRTEFYFEKSPNLDLFMSILEFHSSLASCAEFIIHQVEKISLSIISDSSGHVHRELDYNFVTTIMKQLLLKAKLKFAQCMDSVGVELCDTYLSRVDVLGILVSTRCKFTPSLQDLAKSDIARRVRDRLVQDDRFHLAMEVSTKCQVDISSVWASWGMGCLKTGDFKGAKEKFHICFKMSTTKASSLQRVELVNSIVSFLESNPLISTLASESDWGSMAQAGSVLFEPHDPQSDGCWLDSTRQQECRYYLQAYGTQLQYVHFLRRHGFLKEACKLIIDKGVTDVFLEGLYVPCLKNGTIQKLEDHMLMLDPSLHVWEPYLMSACRYFNGRSLFHILYHIQVFMKDYIRAAQTCIKFYCGLDGRKTKVIDLVLRKDDLNCAIMHFETALLPKQASREVSTTSVKKMPAADIQKWMDTIHLQLQLVNFLDYQISTVKASVFLGASQGPPIPRSEPLPLTLFGSGQARAALACTAVLADPGLKDGFSLAANIILTFQLPTEDVLCHMAKALVLAERYADVKDLLVLVQSSEICPKSSNDKIIISAVKVLSQHTKDVKHIDRLTALLSDDRNKVQAYIQCGKLKSAYLIAVKRNMADEVRNISRVASQAGQVSIRDICDKWLQQNASGSDTERPGRQRSSRTAPSKRN